MADGDQTGDRPAAFGDHDFDALLLDLVQQSQALRFERSGGDFLFHVYGHITIVISWLQDGPRKEQENLSGLATHFKLETGMVKDAVFTLPLRWNCTHTR